MSHFTVITMSYFDFSGILVCTDVMGRGVDIPDISWVIQYDPPTYSRSVTATFRIFATKAYSLLQYCIIISLVAAC